MADIEVELGEDSLKKVKAYAVATGKTLDQENAKDIIEALLKAINERYQENQQFPDPNITSVEIAQDDGSKSVVKINEDNLEKWKPYLQGEQCSEEIDAVIEAAKQAQGQFVQPASGATPPPLPTFLPSDTSTESGAPSVVSSSSPSNASADDSDAQPAPISDEQFLKGMIIDIDKQTILFDDDRQEINSKKILSEFNKNLQRLTNEKNGSKEEIVAEAFKEALKNINKRPGKNGNNVTSATNYNLSDLMIEVGLIIFNNATREFLQNVVEILLKQEYGDVNKNEFCRGSTAACKLFQVLCFKNNEAGLFTDAQLQKRYRYKQDSFPFKELFMNDFEYTGDELKSFINVTLHGDNVSEINACRNLKNVNSLSDIRDFIGKENVSLVVDMGIQIVLLQKLKEIVKSSSNEKKRRVFIFLKKNKNPDMQCKIDLAKIITGPVFEMKLSLQTDEVSEFFLKAMQVLATEEQYAAILDAHSESVNRRGEKYKEAVQSNGHETINIALIQINILKEFYASIPEIFNICVVLIIQNFFLKKFPKSFN